MRTGEGLRDKLSTVHIPRNSGSEWVLRVRFGLYMISSTRMEDSLDISEHWLFKILFNINNLLEIFSNSSGLLYSESPV